MRDSNEVVTIAGVVNPCQGDSLQQDGCWVVRSGSIMIKVWNCLALIADKCATPKRESPLRESPIHVRETPHKDMFFPRHSLLISVQGISSVSTASSFEM